MYSVENMRNAHLKTVRGEWRESRFFFGKNRVVQVSLGRSDAEEYKEGLSQLAGASVVRGVVRVGGESSECSQGWYCFGVYACLLPSLR